MLYRYELIFQNKWYLFFDVPLFFIEFDLEGEYA